MKKWQDKSSNILNRSALLPYQVWSGMQGFTSRSNSPQWQIREKLYDHLPKWSLKLSTHSWSKSLSITMWEGLPWPNREHWSQQCSKQAHGLLEGRDDFDGAVVMCFLKIRNETFILQRECLEDAPTRSSHHGAAEMNPTSIHEDAGSTPGLAHWVKDPALP